MIEIKEAVAAAKEFAKEVFDEGELRNLRLEEVEFNEAGKVWRITLGWLESSIQQNPLLAGMLSNPSALPRVYKTFVVDADSGQVQSMKIRETASR